MKNQLIKAVTMATLVITFSFLTTAISASAQSGSNFTVNIPFDSMAGKKILPAGEYKVIVHVGAASKVLMIHSTDGRTKLATPAALAVEGRESSDRAMLVFNRYGDQYFLSQVWEAGRTTGQELPKSPAEREIMGSRVRSAKREAASETVVLIARQQ